MKTIGNVEELHKQIPKLPNDFMEWTRDQFKGHFNLYVGNVSMYDDLGFEIEKGSRKGFCGYCRRYFDAPKEMKAKSFGSCPYCTNKGNSVFSINKKKIGTQIYQTVWLGQKVKDEIFVLRAFRVKMIQWSPVFRSGEDPTDEIELMETRRLYISKDGLFKEYKGWHYDTKKKDWFLTWGTTGGENTNNSGPVYPETYQNSKGTAAEYSCLALAEEEGMFATYPNVNNNFHPYAYTKDFSIWDYLLLYAKDRKVEMLLKLGMGRLIQNRMQGLSINYNWRAKNPWDYLRIYKSRIPVIQDANDSMHAYLALCQEERKKNEHWSEDELHILAIVGVRNKAFNDIAAKFMTTRQFANRVMAYMDRHEMTMRKVVIEYLDYLKIKADLGFDMKNTVYQFPRDLLDAHQKAVDEQNSKEDEIKVKTAERKYQNIRKRFEKANKIYTWENKSRMIRPAMSAEEIIREGRILHHCVGGDNYLKAHNEGRNIILFLRKKKEADVPYITVELTPTGEIRQWYGKCDRKTDEKTNSNWLKNWIRNLDKKAIANEMKAQKKKGEKVG